MRSLTKVIVLQYLAVKSPPFSSSLSEKLLGPWVVTIVFDFNIVMIVATISG